MKYLLNKLEVVELLNNIFAIRKKTSTFVNRFDGKSLIVERTSAYVTKVKKLNTLSCFEEH